MVVFQNAINAIPLGSVSLQGRINSYPLIRYVTLLKYSDFNVFPSIVAS